MPPTAASPGELRVLFAPTSDLPDDPQAASALSATLDALIGSQKLTPVPGQKPYALVNTSVQANDPPASLETFLQKLVRAASAAGMALSCGSVLAGHTSEADDFGDIALYLGQGDFGPGHERDVVNALGLCHLLERDHQTPLSPTEPVEFLPVSTGVLLPRTVDLLVWESAPAHELPCQIGELCNLLRTLRNPHAFRIPGDQSIYFLLGQHVGDDARESDTDRWIGLAGVGVTTR